MTKLLGLPILVSEHGADVDNLIVYVHYLMIALFIGWFGYFLYAIYRFRASKNPKADYVGVTSHTSSYVEAAVALVEGILLIGFAVPLWAKSVDSFPNEKEATVIRITAEQFTWTARYPGKDGTFGRQDLQFVTSENPLGVDKSDPASKDDVTSPPKDIHVPLVQVGEKNGKPLFKPVIVHITSKDVIHCFKLVPFRVTQDAIPGMSIPVHFIPNREGNYQITCAQLCGVGHYSMNGKFIVENEASFNKWLEEKSKAGGGGGNAFE